MITTLPASCAYDSARPKGVAPAFLELPLNLPAGASQIQLTNLVGLMPGTVGVELAAEMTDGRLHLQVLHRDLPVVAEARALERHIAALFGDVA